jgi:hypothetical protein
MHKDRRRHVLQQADTTPINYCSLGKPPEIDSIKLALIYMYIIYSLLIPIDP